MSKCWKKDLESNYKPYKIDSWIQNDISLTTYKIVFKKKGKSRDKNVFCIYDYKINQVGILKKGLNSNHKSHKINC